MAKLARLQDRLLAAAGEMLAPGGRLVYCTCALQAEEIPKVAVAPQKPVSAYAHDAVRLVFSRCWCVSCKVDHFSSEVLRQALYE